MDDCKPSVDNTEIPSHVVSAQSQDDAPVSTDAPTISDLDDKSDQVTANVDSANDEAQKRPADVPDKFWDASTGAVRTEALLKSYLQLEKKLGAMMSIPTENDPDSRQRLQRALGRPDSPDDYQVEAPHELIKPDPTINAKLHEAGLTSEQAQLVYNLAAEHVLPVIEKVTVEADQTRELSQLSAHFGGEQNWQALAPQIKTWAQANLSADVYETLGSSCDGVIAMHQMMQAKEPSLISEAAVPTPDVNQDQLTQMMRDPRYWRDRDPAFVGRVTEGYKRLFG